MLTCVSHLVGRLLLTVSKDSIKSLLLPVSAKILTVLQMLVGKN